MNSLQMNENHPLTKYVREKMKENVGKNFNVWNHVSELTGLNQQNLILLCKKNREESMKTTIGTYVILREQLNVDLLDKNY